MTVGVVNFFKLIDIQGNDSHWKMITLGLLDLVFSHLEKIAVVIGICKTVADGQVLELFLDMDQFLFEAIDRKENNAECPEDG